MNLVIDSILHCHLIYSVKYVNLPIIVNCKYLQWAFLWNILADMELGDGGVVHCHFDRGVPGVLTQTQFTYNQLETHILHILCLIF